jgi:hypothetical protein
VLKHAHVGPEPQSAHHDAIATSQVAHNGRLRWLNWRAPLA